MNARLLLGAWLVGCTNPTAILLAEPAPVGDAGGRALVQPPATSPATRPAGLLSFKSLAFSRAQRATEFAADGTIYTVGNDALRWDPTGTLVRLEKPHVQWALHNEDLTEAVWKKTNCTIVDGPPAGPRSGETGRPAQSIVATAAGDAAVEQKLAVQKLNVGNGSVFIRSDGPPQQVTIEMFDGEMFDGEPFDGKRFDGPASASKTVTSTDRWQRIHVIGRQLSQPPTIRVGIRGAAAGARVSVWGINAVGLPTRLIGQVPSHMPTEAKPVSRVQDLLIASAEQVPAHMLTQPWGFRWRPSFGNTGVGEAGAEHDDVTFFSVKNLYHEIVYASPRDKHAVLGTVVHGVIGIRADDAERNTAPIARTQDFTFEAGDTIEVRVNPQNGHIWIGGARSGNGRGVRENPWTWPAGHSMWIGERNTVPNTHGLDGFISEPYAVEPF